MHRHTLADMWSASSIHWETRGDCWLQKAGTVFRLPWKGLISVRQTSQPRCLPDIWNIHQIQSGEDWRLKIVRAVQCYYDCQMELQKIGLCKVVIAFVQYNNYDVPFCFGWRVSLVRKPDETKCSATRVTLKAGQHWTHLSNCGLCPIVLLLERY